MCPDSPIPAAAPARRLFPPLSPETVAALAAYPGILRRELGLTPGMERALPRSVRDLSLSLTAEREGGPKPGYLGDPRTLAAYAWYFLPWNILRLSRLLPALPLDLPDDGLVCDLGAGPLTFLQALWLSRPDLRAKRLRFLCVDRSRRALDLGLGLFRGLAGFDPAAPDAPWRVRLLRGEYWQGLTEGASLIAMVNVANELAGAGREPLDVRMERLAGQLADSLAPGGRTLVVEPGTRLGWRCLLGLREAFLEMGLGLDAPCPHGRECSLVAGRTRAWCHFTMSPAGAPDWLTGLSARARLGKERLSLSFLLAVGAPPAFPENVARVVSGAFSLADAPGAAVYGCSQRGLVVLHAPDGRAPRPGDAVELPLTADAPRDAKSGAPRLVLPGHDRPKEGEGAAPARAREGARPDREGERPGQGAGRPVRKGPPGPGAPARPGKKPRAPRPARSGGDAGPRPKAGGKPGPARSGPRNAPGKKGPKHG
ncbi:small ribosomal subunit Rsm22 family protein [Solidesulfovibrio sp.]|uniref:small ribosomal subunit Rsm22 family protein n=1 Tax=Solidesulfovibrio sp. TaxID=2910990 RepID=UPI0026203EE1|nr:small ribosomal subunit Rsm22 family protein [Solidesulfovibrio sp.]